MQDHDDDLDWADAEVLAEVMRSPLSPEAALAELRRCDDMDGEKGHEAADRVLLRLIGDERVARAFLRLTRWYA